MPMLRPEKGSGASIPPIRFRIFSLLCSKAAVLAGVAVLLGRWRGLPFLTSVLPGLAAMKPNTAVALFLSGISLRLYHGAQGGSRRKRSVCGWLSRASAVIVILLGLTILVGHIADISFGIDDLLFPATLTAAQSVNPSRMPPAATLSFLLIGLALLSLLRTGRAWQSGSQFLALATTLVGFVGFLAYFYDVPLLGGPKLYSSMALHTWLLLAMLGAGVLFACPDCGWVAQISSSGFGGLMARRLLPRVIVFPIVLGSVWQYGWRRGLYGAEFTSALTVISAVVLLCFLVLRSAIRLNRLDQQRHEAQERDSWLAAIVDGSTFAIIGRAVDGTVNSWNRAAECLLGYSEAEILGKSFSALIPSERQGEIQELLSALREGRAVQRYQTVCIRRGGDPIDIALAQSPVAGSDARIMGAAILVDDISQQRRNQALLQESQSQLHAVVHSAMDAVIIVDSRHDIVLSNPAAEKMFGYSVSELQGQSLSRLIPEGYRAAHTEHMQRFAQAGITSRAMGALNTVYGQRANGDIFPIEASISQFESGGQKLLSAIVRDVSERQNTEDALRSAQEQLLSTFEAGNMGTWSWDISRDAVSWTEPLLRLLGISREDVSNHDLKTFLSLVHAADRSTVEKALDNAVQKASTYEVEYRSRRRDGALQWIAARGRLEPEAHGQASRLTGVCMDITARKRLEETLLQSHKMEALGTLAGGVAHDFNNILMAIAGNAELAAAELSSDHPARQSLDRIEKASSRAADLVRQILTFSRRQPPARKVISLHQEVEEAVKLLRATLPARIEIRTEYLADIPPISADPTQVHQILMNLGTNASYALGESSGLIEVRLEGVSVSGNRPETSADLPPGVYARLSFRDNGCGMDKITMSRIFEPFFTTKGAGRGTGLGLSVVHGIMTNHSGAVTVHSEVGKGTIFQLYFPAAPQQADSVVSGRSPQGQIPRGHGERILHVDDEEALVLITRRRLEQMGYQVTSFTDPREALETFRTRPGQFDMLLTDVSMPHLPGAELVQAVRLIRPDIPVIMTSGYLRSEDHAAAERLGIRELISKPFDLGELGRALHRSLAALASQKT